MKPLAYSGRFLMVVTIFLPCHKPTREQKDTKLQLATVLNRERMAIASDNSTINKHAAFQSRAADGKQELILGKARKELNIFLLDRRHVPLIYPIYIPLLSWGQQNLQPGNFLE